MTVEQARNMPPHRRTTPPFGSKADMHFFRRYERTGRYVPLGRMRGALLCFVSTIACLLPPPAWCLDDDVIGITLIGSDRYDSNLFRLPDGIEPYLGNRRSATTRSDGIGLQIDKAYGLQQFDLSGSVIHQSYSPYHSLDTTTKTFSGSWHWSLTPELTGNILVSRSEAPNNFSDTGVTTEADVRKTEDERFDLDWMAGAALHPRFSILSDTDKSRQTTFNRQNSETHSLEGGLIYQFRSSNTVELYFRRGRGSYSDVDTNEFFQSDSRYNEHETGLAAHYVSSGLSSFDAKLGYLSREHETFSSRNFEGPVGHLAYTYVVTGKTQLQLQADRTLNSAQSFVSSYSSDTTLSVTPIWNATAKITLRPSYSVTRRTFRGAIVAVPDNLEMTMHTANLQVDWNIYRTFVVSVLVSKENRSSNDRTFQYSDRAGSITATARF